MQSNLNRLKITEKDVEALSGMEMNDVLMLEILLSPTWQIFRNYKCLSSFLKTQFFIFSFSLIFVFPIGLIVGRNSGNSFEDAADIFEFLQITLVISLIITAGWNTYLWNKGNNMAELIELINEINKYNEIIEALTIIEQLEIANESEVNLSDREDLIEAININRESLISALKTERVMRKNKDLVNRRYELLANIENNFSRLITLNSKNKTGEYGRLLNESIQIGIAVHKEPRKLQKR